MRFCEAAVDELGIARARELVEMQLAAIERGGAIGRPR
jgi:hypothetical protein